MAVSDERTGHIFNGRAFIEQDFQRPASRIPRHDNSRTGGIQGALDPSQVQNGGNFALKCYGQRQSFRLFAEIGNCVGVSFGSFCPFPHRELRKRTADNFRKSFFGREEGRCPATYPLDAGVHEQLSQRIRKALGSTVRINPTSNWRLYFFTVFFHVFLPFVTPVTSAGVGFFKRTYFCRLLQYKKRSDFAERLLCSLREIPRQHYFRCG